MIYYFANEDEGEEDITPSEDWYGFSYYLNIGNSKPKEGETGLMISLASGFSRWSGFNFRWTKLLPIPGKIPYDVQQDFIKGIFEAER